MADRPDPALTGPLLVWLAAQLAALSLAVSRLPLSAGYPRPAELRALDVWVATQLSVAALLFPYLARDARSAVAVVATTLPFAIAAGTLSGVSAFRTCGSAAYVTAWLGGLALWRAALRTRRSQMLAVAAATLLAIGQPIACYLRHDFATSSEFPLPGTSIWMTSPTLLEPWGWLPVVSIVITGALAAAITPRFRRRRPTRNDATSYPP